MNAESFAEVVAAVRDWPAEQRLALMQEIVTSLRAPRRPIRPKTIDRAAGLLRGAAPAPTDEACDRIIEEERLAKYAS